MSSSLRIKVKESMSRLNVLYSGFLKSAYNVSLLYFQSRPHKANVKLLCPPPHKGFGVGHRGKSSVSSDTSRVGKCQVIVAKPWCRSAWSHRAADPRHYYSVDVWQALSIWNLCLILPSDDITCCALYFASGLCRPALWKPLASTSLYHLCCEKCTYIGQCYANTIVTLFLCRQLYTEINQSENHQVFS